MTGVHGSQPRALRGYHTIILVKYTQIFSSSRHLILTSNSCICWHFNSFVQHFILYGQLIILKMYTECMFNFRNGNIAANNYKMGQAYYYCGQYCFKVRVMQSSNTTTGLCCYHKVGSFIQNKIHTTVT